MELNECINTRRSIRGYEKHEITEDTVIELIKSAQMAPSWKNSQTARFYVALSRESRDKVHSLLPDFNKERTADVSCFIVTSVKCGRSGCDSNAQYCTHLGKGFQCFDNGLSVENLLLKAHEMGLGTLIMGLYDEGGLRELFSVPENEDIVVVIAVGKPALSPDAPKRRELDTVLKIF